MDYGRKWVNVIQYRFCLFLVPRNLQLILFIYGISGVGLIYQRNKKKIV